MAEIQTVPEPSIADIRAMFSGKPASEAAPVVVSQEPKTITPETPPAEPVERPRDEHGKFVSSKPEEKVTEAEPGAARGTEPKVAAEEETEVELPPGVQKRIEAEARKQATIQRKIDEAISARKAKEHEFETVTAAEKTGPQPAPTSVPAKAIEGRPVKPKLEDFQSEADPYSAFDKAQAKYENDHDAWLIAETRRTAKAEIEADSLQKERERAWDEAVEEHGAEFPDLMEVIKANSSEGLQLAFSGLKDWATVAVHLAKHPDELKSLSTEFGKNPYRAVAELGKLEDRLTKKSEPISPPPAKKAESPLPAPPPRVGGRPSAESEVDLEKSDMRTFKREVRGMLVRQ